MYHKTMKQILKQSFSTGPVKYDFKVHTKVEGFRSSALTWCYCAPFRIFTLVHKYMIYVITLNYCYYATTIIIIIHLE